MPVPRMSLQYDSRSSTSASRLSRLKAAVAVPASSVDSCRSRAWRSHRAFAYRHGWESGHALAQLYSKMSFVPATHNKSVVLCVPAARQLVQAMHADSNPYPSVCGTLLLWGERRCMHAGNTDAALMHPGGPARAWHCSAMKMASSVK